VIPRKLKRAGLYLAVAVCGFVVGVVGLYLHEIRSGPCLEPWHTTKLEEEFTAKRVNEIRTFGDYLSLEDKLFAELDEEIYAETGTGPAYALVRYSPDSRSDPGRWDRNWNRSYELQADNPPGGVLMLHGMSDSPYSLRALGESLNGQGYWVVGLRLPGHGTVPSGMKTVRWQDMVAAVRLAADHLATRVGPDSIHIVGYSTGAPLALNLTLGALDGDGSPLPRSLVLISPAMGITRAAALAKWQGRLSLLPGLEKAAWTATEPEFDPFKYNSFTTNAGDQVFRLTRQVAAEIEARAAAAPITDFPPTLAFLSTVDATVSVDAVVDNLMKHLAPPDNELVLYDVNRLRLAASVLVSDPGPLTDRLMNDDELPFALTLITNADGESDEVVRRRSRPHSAEVITEPMEASWPPGMISLSHVALPFPPDDPLYGAGPPPRENRVFLGEMAIKGERGLLRFPLSWLMRLRHNPFYDYQEARIVEWFAGSG
jgi:alpha-beta hydrolase superfamily lysophospholipase